MASELLKSGRITLKNPTQTPNFRHNKKHKMLNSIFQTATNFFKSFSAISKYGLWKFVVATGVLSCLVAYAIFKLVWKQSDRLGDWLSSFYKWERGSNFISSASDWLIFGVLFVLCLILYKYIMLIVSAPIMSMVSEKIELKKTGGKAPAFSLSRSMKSLVRGLRIALRNISKELLLTALLLLLGLIPIVGLFSAVLIFIVQANYAGFGACDFYMERHFSVRESVKFIRRNRGIAIANGAIFLGLLAIPIVGFFLAPILTAIGATLTIHPKISTEPVLSS